jgi:hypothetical protein
MMWDPDQRRRLALEKQILDARLPGFRWFNPALPGLTFLLGPITSSARNTYTIKVSLPPNYPSGPPRGYVVRPRPLSGHRGQSLLATDVAMHTLPPDEEGHVQICLYRSDRWVESNTIFKVVVKIQLWLEGFEAHLATGLPIDHYLAHM